MAGIRAEEVTGRFTRRKRTQDRLQILRIDLRLRALPQTPVLAFEVAEAEQVRRRSAGGRSPVRWTAGDPS